MVENIKDKIAYVSRRLFNTYGYQKVTMRRIADECGISVGNLTYHYPRKEDLLMLEHDGIMNAFLDEVLKGKNELAGMRGYFTVECAFLHTILFTPAIARLYAQVINVPALRTRYCRTHHRLYQLFLPEAADTGPEWNATVAVSAMEFELADEGILADNYPVIMEDILRARLLFEDKNPEDYAGDIRVGVKAGIRLSSTISVM